MRNFILVFLLFFGVVFAGDKPSPLLPVKLDSPRDTMQSFMDAMNDYRSGMEENDERKIARISDAIRTLNLEEMTFVMQEEKGKEAAIYLKEVIDRIIIINYDLVPGAEKPVDRWRLKDTEIVISRIESGDRKGEYLFSRGTVARAREFYSKVRHLPYLEGSGQGAYLNKPLMEEYLPFWARRKMVVLYNWQWAGLFVLLFLGLTLRVFTRVFLTILLGFFEKSRHKYDDRIIKVSTNPLSMLVTVGFWYMTIHLLSLEGSILGILKILLSLLLSLSAIWLVYRLTGILTEYLADKASSSDSSLDDQLVPLFNKSLKVFVVIFGVLVAAQGLGINVMSLLAGLGLGGLAFALAAKDTVANFFGSLMILFDRPFQVGDWIIAGGAEGNVEEIGFRSTRIRTFYNSVISVPNSVLMNESVDNMGRREYRRLKTFLGITYDTPPEKIEAFLEGIKNIIKANPHTRKDYYHVVFNDYGSDSLVIMLYLFFKTPDWSEELVARNNFLLEVKRLASELEVEFAFPTQTLHIESTPKNKPLPKSVDKNKIREVSENFGPGGGEAKPEGLGFYTPPSREKN